MAKQTINIGASPNDGTGTPLRTAFDYTNQNFTELYTATGPSGNNIVVPGNATITGDLTVDTSTLKVDSANNRVGIGTASPSGIFHAANLGTAGTTADNFNGYFSSANRNCSIYLLAKNTEGSNFYFGDGDNNTVGGIIYDHTSNYMRFDANGSEQMRLNATGLGVGAVPSGNNQLTIRSSGAGTEMTVSLGRALAEGIIGIAAGTNGFVNGSVAGDMVVRSIGKLMLFNNNANAGITIDTAANVGIGVQPSAWASLYRAQTIRNHISQFAFWDGSDSLGGLVNGAYINSSYTWTYSIAGKKPSMYVLSEAGNHVWSVAGTGSVGGAVTWTPAMTLDASGNLFVGTTAIGPWNTRLTLSTDSGTTKWSVGPWSSGGDTNFAVAATNSAGGVFLAGTAATSWTAISDERLKDIIEPITNAVTKIGSLRTVIGKFKNDENNTRKAFLIAQDVQAVLPEAVDASNPDRLGLAYTEVIPLLVAAIKELTARVQTLETR